MITKGACFESIPKPFSTALLTCAFAGIPRVFTVATNTDGPPDLNYARLARYLGTEEG